MAYFIWLYLGNISNRFRGLAISFFRLGLISLVVEYLILAQHNKPVCYDQVMSWIGYTWLVVLASFILVLLPSQSFILNVLALRRKDHFFRNGLIVRIFRLIKYQIKYNLLNRPKTPGFYERIVTPKRLKLLCWAMYIYDLYQVYRKLIVDFGYLILAYFSFASATWLYVKLTGANIYYIHLIDKSFAWGVALVGFLIFKILFFPDWKTIQNIILGLIVRMVIHKLGLVKVEAAVDDKLSAYKSETEEPLK